MLCVIWKKMLVYPLAQGPTIFLCLGSHAGRSGLCVCASCALTSVTPVKCVRVWVLLSSYIHLIQC